VLFGRVLTSLATNIWFSLSLYYLNLQMRSNEAMARSDADATYFELEQAALEHSLESNLQFEHGKKQRASSSNDQKSGERRTIENTLPSSLDIASPAPLTVSYVCLS
jgi:hypothetical protein